MKVTVTVFLLLMSLTAFGQQKDKKPTYSPPGKLVDVGGYRLHLNCTGKNGATIVLISGAGDFSFDWGLVQSGVSRFARVCSYDRAGLAWSDPGPTPHTMGQDAYELHTLLKAARIKGPYVLVGHSVGGLIGGILVTLAYAHWGRGQAAHGRLGLGGVLAELLNDVSLRLCPLDSADVEDMPHAQEGDHSRIRRTRLP